MNKSPQGDAFTFYITFECDQPIINALRSEFRRELSSRGTKSHASIDGFLLSRTSHQLLNITLGFVPYIIRLILRIRGCVCSIDRHICVVDLSPVWSS